MGDSALINPSLPRACCSAGVVVVGGVGLCLEETHRYDWALLQ